MEVCASHYWGVRFRPGHRVRLIGAICQSCKRRVERAQDPPSRGATGIGSLSNRRTHEARQASDGTRTASAPTDPTGQRLARLCAGDGFGAPVGCKGLAALRSEIEADAALPEAATEALRLLGREFDQLEARLAAIDKNLLAQYKADPDSRRLSAFRSCADERTQLFAHGRCDAVESGRISRHGWAWCRARFDPAASCASAALAAPVTSGCVSCCAWRHAVIRLPARGARASAVGFRLALSHPPCNSSSTAPQTGP